MNVLRDLMALLRLSNFRKLFSVRIVSQLGDGMFQVGLATTLFFNPEKASTVSGVAMGFVVMLAPFTVVGPFAGIFLDRWSRRQILAVGNAVRVLLTLPLAIVMYTGYGNSHAWIVYTLGLGALSVNRFLLAGLSAGLPRVVDGKLLITANSLTPTLGAGASFLGGGIGLVVGLVATTPAAKNSGALICAAIVFAVASLITLRMPRMLLGPEHPAQAAIRNEFTRVVRGLGDGARYLVQRRTPGQALSIMAVHRFLYGVVFIASISISRNLLNPSTDTDAGIATFATILALTAVGGAGAIVLTPTLSPKTGPHLWISLMLGLAALTELFLATTPSAPVIFVSATVLGLAAQSTKIAVDTIVQRDTHDIYRGRAFAFYDVLYNAAFVIAAALAAFTLPDDGYSRVVFIGLGVVYAIAGILFGMFGSRTPAEVVVDRGHQDDAAASGPAASGPAASGPAASGPAASGPAASGGESADADPGPTDRTPPIAGSEPAPRPARVRPPEAQRE